MNRNSSCSLKMNFYFNECKSTNRKIAKQLQRFGLKYEKGRPAGNFTVRDRELITSQNPYSNEAFNKLYIEALKELEQIRIFKK